MTRLIKYSEICTMGDFAIYFTKDSFGDDDLIIAQSDNDEYWFEIHNHTTPEFTPTIKTGYIMYVLTKHIK